MIAGAGSGLLFKAAVGTVAASAAPAVRGEALAGLFLIGYLGLVGPVLGLGVATRYVTATTAMFWFTALLLILLILVALLSRKGVTRRAISQVDSSRIAPSAVGILTRQIPLLAGKRAAHPNDEVAFARPNPGHRNATRPLRASRRAPQRADHLVLCGSWTACEDFAR